jgi:hypothetical protein
MLLMPVGGKTVLFELHHYCGPIPCSKRTLEPLSRIPAGFWEAYKRWDQGGRLVDGETCVLSLAVPADPLPDIPENGA